MSYSLTERIHDKAISLGRDLKALLARSRIFVMSAAGALVMAWPQIADTITSFQPVADVLGYGNEARTKIAIALFVGTAIKRWMDHRGGDNPA